jgi:hypothetical protein
MNEAKIKIVDINAAEIKIATILRDLEASTGQLVETIKIENLDVTTRNDTRQEWMRSVHIELKRLPGTKWATF